MSHETQMAGVFEQLSKQSRHIRGLALERISERARIMIFTAGEEGVVDKEKLKRISKKADQMLLENAEYNVVDFRLDIDQLVDGVDKSILQRLLDMI